MSTILRPVVLTAIVGGLCLSVTARAQELPAEQQRIRERMEGVERRLLELIETTEQPERADRLRRALTLSRDALLVSRMREIASLLAEGRYAEARQAELAVLDDLQLMADALTEGEGAERLDRLRRAAEELDGLLRRQTAAADATSGVDPSDPEELGRLADLQEEIREDTEKLRAALGNSPGGEELALAVPSMEAAREALRRAQVPETQAEQGSARERLEAARDAVRDAIRRAEAQRRSEARRGMVEVLRGMLEEQREISADTVDTAGRVGGSQRPGRAVMLRLADLAERERALARRVRDAAALLDDFGRTVAWPEAMARLEEDLLACGDLLDEADVEPARVLQKDIEDILETLMQVLSAAPETAERPPDRERQDRERRQRERPPVNMAEELKVLRTLQSALNRRTARLDERRGVLESPELGSGVERLAERQAALREGLLELEQLAAGGEAE
ncbi:MAG: hypothetical protein R6X33_17945 [Candidatus Brocadiia bacterium]